MRSPGRRQARFDTIFFAFWLSHVPASRLGPFWRQLPDLVAGRALLIDEQADVRHTEDYAAGSGETIRRRLADSSGHRLVKVFIQGARPSPACSWPPDTITGSPVARRELSPVRWRGPGVTLACPGGPGCRVGGGSRAVGIGLVV